MALAHDSLVIKGSDSWPACEVTATTTTTTTTNDGHNPIVLRMTVNQIIHKGEGQSKA